MDSDTARPLALVEVLQGKTLSPPPIWLMRQAGRYLPEYKRTRATAGSFLDLCYNPDFAVEVTLQPIRRFAFDASILFADILLVPDALGQTLTFEAGEGPRLFPVVDASRIPQLDPEAFLAHLAPVFETVRRLRAELPRETALIGFAGAPWTVATYMIGGTGSPDQADARLFAHREPKAFDALMEVLIEATAVYVERQITAGANVIQIFDSWASQLSARDFGTRCIAPMARLVSHVKRVAPHVPVIGFPRGAGTHLERYVDETGVDGLGLDTGTDLRWARWTLGNRVALQGNLDPLALVAGGEALRENVLDILDAMSGCRHIFNLGHGILPETPIEHVEELLALIRG